MSENVPAEPDGWDFLSPRQHAMARAALRLVNRQLQESDWDQGQAAVINFGDPDLSHALWYDRTGKAQAAVLAACEAAGWEVRQLPDGGEYAFFARPGGRRATAPAGRKQPTQRGGALVDRQGARGRALALDTRIARMEPEAAVGRAALNRGREADSQGKADQPRRPPARAAAAGAPGRVARVERLPLGAQHKDALHSLIPCSLRSAWLALAGPPVKFASPRLSVSTTSAHRLRPSV